DYDLLSLRIELVDPLGRPIRRHAEGRGAPCPLLGEDSLRFANRCQRLSLASFHLPAVPLDNRVATSGEHAHLGHQVCLLTRPFLSQSRPAQRDSAGPEQMPIHRVPRRIPASDRMLVNASHRQPRPPAKHRSGPGFSITSSIPPPSKVSSLSACRTEHPAAV